MRIKRLIPIILAVLTVLVLAVSTVWATTYNTVTFNGTPGTDFAADEKLGSDGNFDFYLTWDENNFYVAWAGSGLRTNWWSHGCYIQFDTDPGGTNGLTSEYGGLQHAGSNTTKKPDYVFTWENSDWMSGGPEHRAYVSGGAWVTGDVDYTDYIVWADSNGVVEWAIPFSSLTGWTPGNPIGIIMWVVDSDGSYYVRATMPTGNPTGSQPQTASHRIYYSSTGSGVSPNSFYNAPTAITLSSFTAVSALPAAFPWLAGAALALGGALAWRRKRG